MRSFDSIIAKFGLAPLLRTSAAVLRDELEDETGETLRLRDCEPDLYQREVEFASFLMCKAAERLEASL